MPGSIHATNATMPALMTSRKKPEVNMVIGSVSKMAMGLTTELTTPSKMPAMIRVAGVSIETPLTQSVASQIPSATSAARMRNPSIAPSLPCAGLGASIASSSGRYVNNQARERRIFGDRPLPAFFGTGGLSSVALIRAR